MASDQSTNRGLSREAEVYFGGGWVVGVSPAKAIPYRRMEEIYREVAGLKESVDRLSAFIKKVHNSSTCPATVLVAGQVLDGHDVRAVKDNMVLESPEEDVIRAVCQPPEDEL